MPIKNIVKKTNFTFGILGLRVLECGEVSKLQLETVRKIIAPFLKKKQKLIWRVFPCFYKTSKSFGSRMGSGKGACTILYIKVRPGQFLFEFTNVLPNLFLLKLIASKFNVKTV